MTNSKQTKRALLGSVMALLICFSMLLGTTFAWFTDTATASVNKIQAGTLDVTLEVMKNGEWASAEGETLDFVKAAGHEDEPILWEPGCTYALPDLRIRNNGNLSLKYKVVITGIKGDAKLNEAIDWKFDGLVNGEGNLTAGESSGDITISGHMKETAGNEYQGLTIEGIAITVYATQDTVEYDSSNNTYDENAEYVHEVGTIEELRKAVAVSDGSVKIVLTKDITLETEDELVIAAGSGNNVAKAILNVRNDAILDLNGKVLKYTGDNATFGIYVGSGANLTIWDSSSDNSGSVIVTDSKAWTVQVGNGTANIYGGYYSTANDCCIYANNGKINIYGGKFECNGANQLTLNIGDRYRGNGRGIYVYGGSFKNFEPGKTNTEEVFLGNSYKVESATDGSDTWYTVVPE